MITAAYGKGHKDMKNLLVYVYPVIRYIFHVFRVNAIIKLGSFHTFKPSGFPQTIWGKTILRIRFPSKHLQRNICGRNICVCIQSWCWTLCNIFLLRYKRGYSPFKSTNSSSKTSILNSLTESSSFSGLSPRPHQPSPTSGGPGDGLKAPLM